MQILPKTCGMLRVEAKSLEHSQNITYTAIMGETLKMPLEASPATDFLSWFQNEYLKRRKKNKNYSVRAFSKYLNICPATVSHLLAGKRKPSVKFAQQLFTKLELHPSEKDSVLASLAKSPVALKSVKSRQENYHLIAMDGFKLMSEWYHYAILEMTDAHDFNFSYPWIANQLGISVTEARQAVERLLRLDLLETKNGTVVKTKSFYTNGDDTLTSSAHKLLQRHVLQKALDAIDTVPIEDKDISSITMAIDESKIPAAKKLITKFRRDLCQFLEKGERQRVFNLAIQLYPISKGTGK